MSTKMLPIITTGRAGSLHSPPLGPIPSRANKLIAEFPLHGAPCCYLGSGGVLLYSSLKFSFLFSPSFLIGSSLRSGIFPDIAKVFWNHRHSRWFSLYTISFHALVILRQESHIQIGLAHGVEPVGRSCATSIAGELERVSLPGDLAGVIGASGVAVCLRHIR